MAYIEHIRDIILKKQNQIHEWINNEYSDDAPLFFCSVDIRDSGSKIAPVDANVFPAGFNNLDSKDLSQVKNAAKTYMDKYHVGEKILLIPESHTRNQFYLKNIDTLKQILEDTNRNVEVEILENILNHNGMLATNSGFIPDSIILNNDLSDGVPDILKNIQDQQIMPSLEYAWHTRRKSGHFHQYKLVLNSFCKEFKLDPFYLFAEFSSCENVNFKTVSGLDNVAEKAKMLLFLLNEEYSKHNIKQNPYLFIKADSGTYGMGIMHITDAEQIYSLNKDARKKMHKIKGGAINDRVIIQEGVETALTYQNNVAEALIYLLAGDPMKKLLRVNAKRDNTDNLNKAGATFVAMNDKAYPNHTIYSLISQLSCLAATKEFEGR